MRTLRHAPAAARILLGVVFTVFGANFFLHFLPQPPMPPGPALDFLGALGASGFVMTLVKVTEIAAGLMLLANRFVPLALALLAPVVVGIVGFHLALAPASGGPAYLTLALELYLAYAYRAAFAPMLQARVAPAEPSAELSARRPQVASAAS